MIQRFLVKFMLGCSVCASSLFAGLVEDKEKIVNVSDNRHFLEVLQAILNEKISKSEQGIIGNAQYAINDFLISVESWRTNPGNLSFISWHVYPKFVHAYSLLQSSSIQSDEIFARCGYKQEVIEKALNLKVVEAFQEAKKIPFLLEDCDANYLPLLSKIDQQEAMNRDHVYLMLEDLQKESLKPILASLKEPITNCLESAWRVVAIRCGQIPQCNLADQMPAGVHKILYYPFGADADGVQFVDGTWLLYKNSEILERESTPRINGGLAIEIFITPSIEYDLQPVSAGLNAFYPRLPWSQLASISRPSYPAGSIVGVNIGGGPHWSCREWANLEEVTSYSNPHPFILHPNCRFPFADRSIKIIYTSHTMEHLNLSTMYRVLSESNRILEAGGNFIIKIPDFDRALDCWRRQDVSFFGEGWNLESVTPTWKSRGLFDCLDYRAAMIFCSFYNDAYGNPFAGGSSADPAQAYFGPANVDVAFLRNLIKDRTPFQITQALRLEIAKNEPNYYLCHQSAWSRAELQDMLNQFGFEVISFDANAILRSFGTIPGIGEMLNLSTFCWAKKRA